MIAEISLILLDLMVSVVCGLRYDLLRILYSDRGFIFSYFSL